ncbi:hypothetical protein B9Z19DRAFT_1124260 [Tuber borchii]|uniref:Uncharacterized protein n=1 Tax=Tuber borchii TaxID=42251 RepID=A0A2T6ZWZ6_TUBBO|nr:hypothetical protein B9Z19DRAFT_1124260 [Tuber borchii]
MTTDILAVQGASVRLEYVFSMAQEVILYHHSRLQSSTIRVSMPVKFYEYEELQLELAAHADEKKRSTETDNGYISDDDESHQEETVCSLVDQDGTRAFAREPRPMLPDRVLIKSQHARPPPSHSQNQDVDPLIDSEGSGNDGRIWDSAVNMYIAANTEEEEKLAEEEPQISGEEMRDLESIHDGDNLDVGHIEGLAGHQEEIRFKEQGQTDLNATIGVTNSKRSGTGNKVEVFFQNDSYGEWAPPTSRKITLEETQAEMIFVIVAAGLNMIYRDEIGEYVGKAMGWNIVRYASIEQVHAKLGSLTTKDTNMKGHMKKALLSLFKAMGAITTAQRILLTAVALDCLQEYKKILGKCLDHRTSCETDERECEFEVGDFCITELKRRGNQGWNTRAVARGSSGSGGDGTAGTPRSGGTNRSSNAAGAAGTPAADEGGGATGWAAGSAVRDSARSANGGTTGCTVYQGDGVEPSRTGGRGNPLSTPVQWSPTPH